MADCPACHHPNPARARFCNQCGQGLGPALDQELEQSQQDNPAEVPATPSANSYTPRHLAEKILSNAPALQGERKQVTVMFADVKNSTRLAAQAGPEQWHVILDRLFALLSACVHRFDGNVNQYTGDGIMALFGAPVAHEDHALRAAHAALAIRDQVRSYADELRLAEGLNLSLRVGLNSGEVIVGAIGDDLRMDYTAQGHTVNLAARMEAIAEPGRIYLTANTANKVDGYFRLRDLGTARVDGVDEALGVFELEGSGEIETRLGLSMARGLSGFVGREPELAQLEQLLREVRTQASGAVVAVSGNAGIGKSRLCHEFVQRCRARGVAVYSTTAVPYAEAMPYYPVKQLLLSYFSIGRNDTPEVARRKIAGTLLLRDDSARDSLGMLFEFLGLEASGDNVPAQAAGASPEQRMQQLRELCGEALAGKSQPAVLLLEDMHWADTGSIEFFCSLFACLAEAPLLVICNHRSDYLLDWLQAATTEDIRVEALDDDAIEGLLRELLGQHASLNEVISLIRGRVAGNPFFAEEAVHALVDQGVVVGEHGDYRLQTAVDSVTLPESVQALLAARIDRLPAGDRDILHAAAVLGRSFREHWLAAVARIPVQQLQARVQALVDTGFLHPEGMHGNEYEFCHPLMQEVAYQGQLTGKRREQHARAAQVIEQDFAEPDQQSGAKIAAELPGEMTVLLAHHWHQAAQYRQAAYWDLQAAAWLVQRDVAATLARFRSAIQALDRLDPADMDAEIGEMAIAARAGIVRMAAIAQVPSEEVEAAYRQARASVDAEKQPEALAELLLSNAVHVLNQGEVALARGQVDEAIAILERIGDAATLARFRIPVLNVYYTSGALQQGLRVLQGSGEWERAAIDENNLSSRALRATVIAHLGRLDEARVELESAIRIAEAGNRRISWFYGNLVELDYFVGAGENSMHHAETALVLAREFGSPLFDSIAVRAMANALSLQGDHAGAAEILDAGRDQVAAGTPGHWLEGLHLARLAEVLLDLGEMERARRLAQAALEAALTAGAGLWELRARLVQARIGARDGVAREVMAGHVGNCEHLINQTGAIIFNGFLLETRADWHAQQHEYDEANRLGRATADAFAFCGARARAERALQHDRRPAAFGASA